MSERQPQTLREIAADLAKTMRCNCDLDNWVPEVSTGHSWVCRIHKAAVERRRTTPTPSRAERGEGR